MRKPGDEIQLRAWVDEMRKAIGPGRLYARLGFAIISEGDEPETFALARQLGICLVLQGGAIEHHSVAWGFPQLLQDSNKGDRRFAQWFQDGSIADPGKQGDLAFGVRACSSRYAKPVYDLRKRVEQARAARVARAMKQFPDVILACSGPIECEMHQGDNRWGDYSPYTIAEFRDYLTHRGIYSSTGERRGLGYPGGSAWSDDPTPDQAQGRHENFNKTFGTHFATWSLRYWDPEKSPQRVPLTAPGMPTAGSEGYINGGFDAPRAEPGGAGTAEIPAEGGAPFWDAWASVDDSHPGFRSKLLNFWVRDHTRWLAEAGVSREHIFSHQIPGESYGQGRLNRGASAVWTADTPNGSIGITTYFGAASDTDVFSKIVARNPNWGIFEYHPHPIDALKAPVSEYIYSLATCIRFRAHILTPISWTDRAKDFVVCTGPFAQAMKQVMASLPDQPYDNRAYVDYAPPPVSEVKTMTTDGKTAVTWSPRIWPDLPDQWTDWPEFVRFDVRDGRGKILASTRGSQAELPGQPSGLAVVAVKRSIPPKLPPVDGLSGSRGRLRWSESYDFFCDHYRVDVFASADAKKPVRTLTARDARAEVRLIGKGREAWCRVAACDGAGQTGSFSPMVRISLPRPGRKLVDLPSIQPRVEASPDCGWREVAVGGASQPALFEHPPFAGGWSRAEFRVPLPSAARGQRIVFTSDIGLKDGADASDGVIFRVEADGDKQIEQLVEPDHQWHPLEVDLTADAGKEIRLSLMTNRNGNSAADWAAWGDPQVLLVGNGVVDRPTVTGIVALGKEVRGRVTLRWDDRTSDGSLWSKTSGLTGFRVYRGADRGFQPAPASLLGETRTRELVDAKFDGRETFYRVTALFADGTESPASEPVQYAP